MSAYVFGIFIKAIASEFQWGRTYTTAGLLAYYLMLGLGSLSMGTFMARIGVRRTSILFSAGFAIAVVLVGFLPKSVLLFCVLFGLMGFLGGGNTGVTYATAISAWFDRRRGLALALCVSGTGVGAVVLPPYASWLLETYGWRAGYIGVGATCCIVAVAGLSLLFYMPEPRSRPSAGLGNWRAIIADRNFLKIAIAIVLISLSLLGCIVNLVPMLTDRGMTLREAAGLLGVLGAASMVSRLAAGTLLDYWHVRYVGAAIFFAVCAGMILLLLGGSSYLSLLAVIAIGLGIGAEADIVSFAASRYFKAVDLGGSLSMIWLLWAWSAGLGVLIGSVSFDLFGSYQAALLVYGLLAFISGAVLVTLGPYLRSPE